MDVLTLDALKVLVDQHTGLCVSIFMPTHRAGPEIQQDRIRFKNLLREAEDRLHALGLRSPEAKALLEPAQKLLPDSAFWRHQSDGLTVFVAADLFQFYRLPLDLAKLVVVGERFHVRPLFPTFTGDGHFYILALSQNQVRLVGGTRHSVGEIDLEGLPTSLAEALRYDDPERQLQLHTRSPGGVGERAAFHGHGVANEAKDRILRYFHQVDAGLHEALRDKRAPLVLAGVEHLFPIYREANTYPYLVDEGIAGNPEELKPADLHAPAWAIVQPYFLKAQQEAAARYQQLAGTGLTSTGVREIVPAAYHGRIDTLFIGTGVQQWGAFDPDAQVVQVHPEAESGDEDLLDLAAVYTVVNGGTVYAVEPERVPGGAPLAAVFRY